MPAMKKEVHEAVKAKLELEQRKIRGQLDGNRYKMRQLVQEQTRLKRELAAFGELIRAMG